MIRMISLIIEGMTSEEAQKEIREKIDDLTDTGIMAQLSARQLVRSLPHPEDRILTHLSAAKAARGGYEG